MNNYRSILDDIGIKTGKISSKYIQVICPYHSDKSFGSAFVNLNTGWFKCYSCGTNKHSYNLIKKQRPNLNHKQICDILGWDIDITVESILKKKLQKDDKLRKLTYKNVQHTPSVIQSIQKIHKSDLIDFDVNNYRYLIERDVTNDFIRFHKIKLITRGVWKDYIYIPLNEECEIRKIDEYNHFSKLGYSGSLKQCRKQFKFTSPFDDYNESYNYLQKPRVLYSSKENVNKYLFNFNNLVNDRVTYIRESITGCGKIWSQITKNVCATFSNNINSNQLKLISKIKHPVIVPDYDDAGVILVYNLRNVKNIKVLNIKCDDSERNFVNEFSESELLDPIEWILKFYGLEISIR